MCHFGIEQQNPPAIIHFIWLLPDAISSFGIAIHWLASIQPLYGFC